MLEDPGEMSASETYIILTEQNGNTYHTSTEQNANQCIEH